MSVITAAYLGSMVLEVRKWRVVELVCCAVQSFAIAISYDTFLCVNTSATILHANGVK